jgi:2,3-dihydroxybenzoate-AMP ligase
MTTLEGVVPFPPEFAARYREKGYWEDATMGHFFDEIVAQYSERAAFLSGDERVTYRQLAQKVDRLALHLLKLGVQPLDRFVMQLPKRLEVVDDFPLSKFGKVSKHVLVKQITDILAEEEQVKKLAT